MTVHIGLTGPIGCGKSTIARWLADLGATVIDADEVARLVVEPGEPALARVLAAFGEAVRAADGSLDRPALGRIVFADPAALAVLEGILHPAIHERILAAMAAADSAGVPAIVVEAIKLVESGLAALCEEVWLVTCDGATQHRRLTGRGLSDDEARTRMAAQAGQLLAGRTAATRVVDTSGSLETTRAVVARAYAAAIAARRST
ncbi:MAG: dephospho-CoA kinase [Chloroflexi bacterium]|nr:dephospho-CoA kinase [Chloroflexota bacterium]